VRAGTAALATLAAGDADGVDDGPPRSAMLASAVAASPESDQGAMDHLFLTEQALVWPQSVQVRICMIEKTRVLGSFARMKTLDGVRSSVRADVRVALREG
jgi:hypothetical protein